MPARHPEADTPGVRNGQTADVSFERRKLCTARAPSEARRTPCRSARSRRRLEQTAARQTPFLAAELAAVQARGEPLPGSFEAVARAWWKEVHCAKVSEGHAARTLIRLEQDAFPWIGQRPIAELKAADVLACAQRVVQRGAVETAHRLKDACVLAPI